MTKLQKNNKDIYYHNLIQRLQKTSAIVSHIVGLEDITGDITQIPIINEWYNQMNDNLPFEFTNLLEALPQLFNQSIPFVTYDELLTKVNNSELEPGTNYLITDFRTVHHILDNSTSRTGDINTGSLEPLIVKAVTINELDKEAISTAYPKDIIYYNINSDIRDIAFYNDDESPVAGYKGQIYFRHDTIQNVSTWYDFRNVKFRRWLVGATAWVSENSYTAKDVVEYNDILYKCKVTHSGVSTAPDSDFTNWIKWLDKTLNWSWTSDKTLFNVGDITTDNLIMSSPIDLFTFGDYYENVKDVHIGRNDLSILIDGYGVITTLNNIVVNTVNGISCIANTFGELCFNNTIADGFIVNTIGGGFNSNILGDDFHDNIIGNYFNYNTIGDNFQTNTIKSNIGNIDFTQAIHVYQEYDCEIYRDAVDGAKLSYMSGGMMQIVDITD